MEEDGRTRRVSRLVWDERRANERFHSPPKIPLGSAASFSHWDLAAEALGQDSTVYSFTADLPDWFYRVKLPNTLRPFFVFSQVGLDDFVKYMAKRGCEGGAPQGVTL